MFINITENLNKIINSNW